MIQEKYGDYELSSYDKVELTVPDFTVSDAEVTADMERIALRHATNVDIEPRTVLADDMIRINIKTKEDSGETFPGLTRQGVDIQLGVGVLPEDLEVEIVGHEVGDTIEAHFTYIDYSNVPVEHDLRDVPVDEISNDPEQVQLTSTVEILAQRKHVIPEVTDEWVEKNIGLTHTVAEFREKTAKRLLKDRLKKFSQEVEYAVMAEVGKRLVGEVPEDAVESVAKQMNREFGIFLDEYEMTRETYFAMNGSSEEEFMEQVRADAKERVTQDIALVAWAKHFGIEAKDEDINFLFGEANPERTAEARQEADASGQTNSLRDLALRAKVAQLITSEATFLKPDGTVDEALKKEVDTKLERQRLVREHATGDPIMNPFVSRNPHANKGMF